MFDFPILLLPKDIVIFMIQNHLTVPDGRNLIITCKTIYNKIPPFIKKDYLWNLGRIHQNIIMTNKLGKAVDPKSKNYCKKCGIKIKNKKKLQHHRNYCNDRDGCYICGKLKCNTEFRIRPFEKWEKHMTYTRTLSEILDKLKKCDIMLNRGTLAELEYAGFYKSVQDYYCRIKNL